jgi:nucleoside-diphosphate-sugar epimerase
VIVVTGAAGFIGSAVVPLLLASGEHVVGIDAFTPYYDPALKRAAAAELAHPRFRLEEADLLTADLSDLVAGADAVVHLAGQPGVRTSWGSSFVDYTSANIIATERVLTACRDARVSRVVYASSSSVYGEQVAYPAAEEALPRPFSPYGVSKLAAEHLCVAFADNFGLSTVSARLFTVYGPRQRPDMAFSRFIRSIDSGQPVTVTGNGQQVRDFTFVEDVARALVAATVADIAPGTVVNVAGGSSVTLADALGVLESVVGPFDVRYGDAIPGDVHRTGGSIARARELLGWRPSVGLHEGLTRQVEWARGIVAG